MMNPSLRSAMTKTMIVMAKWMMVLRYRVYPLAVLVVSEAMVFAPIMKDLLSA